MSKMTNKHTEMTVSKNHQNCEKADFLLFFLVFLTYFWTILYVFIILKILKLKLLVILKKNYNNSKFCITCLTMDYTEFFN